MEADASSVEAGMPPEKPNRFRRFRPHCHDWLLVTSAHGWARLASYFWRLVILCALAMFSLHLYTLVGRYLERPTAIVMRPYHVDFAPPDIYVCSEQQVSRSQLMLHTSAERDKLFALAKGVIDFRRNHTSNDDINNDVYHFLRHTMDFELLSKAAGHKAEQLFLDSQLSYTSISAEPFFDYRFINCFVFRLKPALFSEPGNYLLLKLFSDDFQTGLTYDNVSFLRTVQPGIRITVMPKDHYPDHDISSILSPGTATTINLSYKKVFTQPTGRNCVTQQKRPILNPLSLRKEYYFVPPIYCTTIALLQEFVRRCGCRISAQYVPFEFAESHHCYNTSYLATFNLSHVHWIHKCVRQVISRTGRIARRHRERCMQFRHCTQHRYDWKASSKRILSREHGSYARFVRGKYMKSQSQNNPIHAWGDIAKHVKNVTQREKIINDNIIKVYITPSESLSTYIEEQYTYPLANLFSDIGGILGLYLGISALTMLEVVELVFVALRILVRKRRNYR